MIIGMTYDLQDDYIAQGFTPEQAGEFDVAETIDAIDAALRASGYDVRRIGNVKALVNALAAGERWDMVFNIAEGVSGLAREAQVPALLEAYDIGCTFSSADVLVLCMDKSMAKHIVRSAGVATPDFTLIRPDSAVDDLNRVNLPYPLFAKPVGEGTSKGIYATSKVSNKDDLCAVCYDLLQKYNQPVLVETFMPGREFTVCILGSGDKARVLGVGEIKILKGGDEGIYSYRNKVECFDDIVIANDSNDSEAVKNVGDMALKAWKALGCRDCGRVDMRLSSEGVPNFLEVNPLSGLRPDYSELPIISEAAGIDYNSLIRAIVESTLERSFPVIYDHAVSG